jgi:CHAT domain-containing protein
MAAARRAGYALIVRAEGKPALVELAGLRAEETARQVKPFRQQPVQAEIRACLNWLAGSLDGVARELAGESDVTLIPIGELSLLPLNAALLQAAGRPLGVRYLPNARAAREPGRTPAYGHASAILAIDVAAAPGERPLMLARSEAEALVRRYGARRVSDSTVADALTALADADIAEFFCHGKAELASPLASGLGLSDGRLTVQMLLSRPPGRRQLIVLSACESHVAGADVPDEVIGLPAALVQAGATGVVASQWRISEDAAAALLRRFREVVNDGEPPATALAVAQGWLRGASGAELAERYPDIFNEPSQSAAQQADRNQRRPFEEPRFWAAFCYTGSQ